MKPIRRNRLQGVARRLGRRPFALLAAVELAKRAIAMAPRRRAWRSYFPVGSELASRPPDYRVADLLFPHLNLRHPLTEAGLEFGAVSPSFVRRLARHGGVLTPNFAMVGGGRRSRSHIVEVSAVALMCRTNESANS